MPEKMDQLIETERKFWSAGPDFYRENVDDKCLVAFAEMAQVMSAEEVAATVKEGGRWKKVDMDIKGVHRPSPGVALLTYDAYAVRANGETYHALVSSAYAKRKDGWKLTFHGQTPISEDGITH